MARGRAAILSGSSPITRQASTVLFTPPTTIRTSTGIFTPGPAIQPPQSGPITAPSPNDTSASGIVGDLLNRAGRAAADRIGREITSRINPPQSVPSTPGGATNPLSPSGFAPDAARGPCPEGRIRVGTLCVDPLAAAPGGRPLAIPAGGDASGMSPLGLYAEPQVETQTRLKCPPGLVLGIDNRCYASLPNKYRKWKKKAKPPITASDMKAIRRAAAAQKRVKKLAGNVGFTCKKR